MEEGKIAGSSPLRFRLSPEGWRIAFFCLFDFAALPPAGESYQRLPYVKEPYAGKMGEPGSNVEWSRGVLDMAGAMKENRPQRITAVQAAHVVDIVCGIQEVSREGRRVEIASEFPPPTSVEWAR